MTPMRAANLLWLLAVSSPLVAQTAGSGRVSTPPRATKSDDKTGVGSDTLYKLAVKPSDHPDEAVVWLLDEGVLRLEPDGRGTRTYRQGGSGPHGEEGGGEGGEGRGKE